MYQSVKALIEIMAVVITVILFLGKVCPLDGKNLSKNYLMKLRKLFNHSRYSRNGLRTQLQARLGWVGLIYNKYNQLEIGYTPNQDNPLMDISESKGYPLLGLDIWKPAYYLDYQNKREDYLNAFWNVVD